MSGFNPSTSALGTGAPVASEFLLVVAIALLAVMIVGLVVIALVVRRRGRAQVAPPVEPPQRPAARPELEIAPRARPRAAVARSGGGGGGLAVATATSMVCPTCRTEYHGLTYCTRDARRLVPPEDMLGGPGLGPVRALGRSAGVVCMVCRRAYEPGLRTCPHDSHELVPFPVYNAMRPRRAKNHTEPAGVIARICPVCGSKFDLNARFCGHDAGQLVVIN